MIRSGDILYRFCGYTGWIRCGQVYMGVDGEYVVWFE